MQAADCLDWMCQSDLFSGGGDSGGGFGVFAGYLPSTAQFVHLRLAQPSLPRIVLPHQDYESMIVLQRNQNIIDSLLQHQASGSTTGKTSPASALSIFARHGWSQRPVVLDVISQLLSMHDL